MHSLRRVAFAAPRQFPVRAAPRAASWQPVARLYSSEAAAAEQKPTETSNASDPSEPAPAQAKSSTATSAEKQNSKNSAQSDDLTPDQEKHLKRAVSNSLSKYKRAVPGYSKAHMSSHAPRQAPKTAEAETAEPKTAQAATPEPSVIPTFKNPPTYASQDQVSKEDVEFTAAIDWDKSYFGASSRPVTKEQYASLMEPIDVNDVEVKPDGVIYLPEIKYRRKLNDVFGPMGWALIPRGEPVVGENIVTREYALLAGGRFVAQSQGENNYFSADGLPSAVEGCKSNALMRCCKDLGVASELWDPRFVRQFRKNNVVEAWVEHAVSKKKRAMFFRKGAIEVAYPWKKT